MPSISISNIYIARMKRLKGGKEIIRSYRRISCKANIPTEPETKVWVAHVNNRQIRAKLHGYLNVDTGDIRCSAEESRIFELKTPYLRKGFKTILGYDVSAVSSH